MTLPLLESYLNWVADPVPPPTHRLDDLTSPASSENTPPMDSSRKLPRRLRPRRIRKKRSASSANENASSHVADPATPLGPSANENSASSEVTRTRSTANRNSPFPGSQPGTSQPPRSALKKHPQTFQPSQHPQHPRSTTNENPERRSRLDHPEIQWGGGGAYKPAQHSIRQDTLTSIHRGSFSGSDLSSPALQRLYQGSFSGSDLSSPALQRLYQDSFCESPSGQLNEKSLTDSGEERIARGRRSGIVYPLPRAARPGTRLTIDVALPEAAALHRTERPPTVLDIPEPRQLEETRCSGPFQALSTPRPLVWVAHFSWYKRRNHQMTWYKQGITDDLLWTKESSWRTLARRRWRPGLPSRRRCPWYKRGLLMTWTRGAAWCTPDHLDFPLFIGKGRPTTPLPPFLFSSDPRNRGIHTPPQWYSRPRISTLGIVDTATPHRNVVCIEELAASRH